MLCFRALLGDVRRPAKGSAPRLLCSPFLRPRDDLSPIPPFGSNRAIEDGHWRAVCQCGIEDYCEPVADRVRLDPLDAKTSRHVGQCEFPSETDGPLLRVLKVKYSVGGDYWWVECGACDTAGRFRTTPRASVTTRRRRQTWQGVRLNARRRRAVAQQPAADFNRPISAGLAFSMRMVCRLGGTGAGCP
jgi:hypothetical protein